MKGLPLSSSGVTVRPSTVVTRKSGARSPTLFPTGISGVGVGVGVGVAVGVGGGVPSRDGPCSWGMGDASVAGGGAASDGDGVIDVCGSSWDSRVDAGSSVSPVTGVGDGVVASASGCGDGAGTAGVLDPHASQRTARSNKTATRLCLLPTPCITITTTPAEGWLSLDNFGPLLLKDTLRPRVKYS